MNRLYFSNNIHHCEGPGVVFSFSLEAYIKAEVKPMYDAEVGIRKTYTMSSVKRKEAAIRVLTDKILRWEKVFAELDNEASTPQLAAKTGFELRSVSKSLFNISVRTTYVVKRIPTKADIAKYGIPYNNRQGCRIWTWNPQGKIDKIDFLEMED